MWSDLVLKNFRNPQLIGQLPQEKNVYRAQIAMNNGNKVQLDIAVQQKKIVDVRYQVFGCPGIIACMSWMATALMNQSYEQAKQITAQQIYQVLQLPASKFHCALLAEELLNKVINKVEGE